MGGHACLVRGCVQSQREERGHHVGAIRHGDPKRDRNQQPPASPQAQIGHPGNHVPHQPLSPAHLQNGTALSPPSHIKHFRTFILWVLLHTHHHSQHVLMQKHFLTRTNEPRLYFFFLTINKLFFLVFFFLSFLSRFCPSPPCFHSARFWLGGVTRSVYRKRLGHT